MIGKVVVVLHTPRRGGERMCVGRLSRYIRVDSTLRIWFEGAEQLITEIDTQQDKFSFQAFDTKE